MPNRFFIIRVLIPTILLGIFVYLGHQIFRFAEFEKIQMLLGLSWLAFITFFPTILPILFWFRTDRGMKNWHLLVHMIAHLCMGYFSYLLFLVVFRDITAFILDLLDVRNFSYNGEESILILSLPFLFMSLGFINVYLGPYVKKIKIKFDDNKSKFEKLKIVQISDLHIGPHVSIRRVKKIVEKVNSRNPDIIVMTGDIIDYKPDVFIKEIAELKNLNAKKGVYFIAGNHEYFWSLEHTIGAIKDLGIRTLLNETDIIHHNSAGSSGKISISGATDPMARMFSLPEPDYELLSTHASEADLKIILCHQSIEADKVSQYNFDIQLSGHTHRGQFIPWSLIIGIFQKYSGGLYRIKNLWLYVNQGTGTWGPPDRFGTYCEITEITIS